MKRTQSYIKIYMITLITGLFLVASFNFVVDPQKIFGVVDIKGFNREKPFILNGGMRKLKSIEIEKGNYDTILLGTSRVLRGLNPQHPIFQSSQVYNAGLAGSGIYEISKVFEFANNNLNIKTALIGLDAFSFNSKKKPEGDFYDSKFYKEYHKLNFIFGELFSSQKFMNSLSTIKFNWQNQDDEYINNGFIKINSSDKYTRRQFFIDYIKFYLTSENFYPVLYDKPQNFEWLKQILKQRKDNTKLYLFISPIHAYQLEAMKHLNTFSNFEEWKRDLVKVIAKDAIENSNKQPIILWDFSGYNSIANEKIPPLGSKQEMKWYWESSHYKKELGDVILDVIFNYPKKSENAPSDFGEIISSKNIESHLQKIRTEQAQYKQNFPGSVEEVERLVRETAHLRKAIKTD
ncbi:MAG: hypothetical protein ACFB02_06140 [Mastigocoleus sp.]